MTVFNLPADVVARIENIERPAAYPGFFGEEVTQVIYTFENGFGASVITYADENEDVPEFELCVCEKDVENGGYMFSEFDPVGNGEPIGALSEAQVVQHLVTISGFTPEQISGFRKSAEAQVFIRLFETTQLGILGLDVDEDPRDPETGEIEYAHLSADAVSALQYLATLVERRLERLDLAVPDDISKVFTL